MKVYLVESGEYSDRQIDCVFSTYEKAEKYIAHCKHNKMWSSYCIMDYEVDDDFVDNDMEVWYKYEVNMTKGRNHCITNITPIYKSDIEHDKIEEYGGNNSIGYRYINFITYHKDKDLSIKSIEDRYAKAKAEEMLL